MEEQKEKGQSDETQNKEQKLEPARKENKYIEQRKKMSYEYSYRIGFIVFIVFLVAVYCVEYKLCNQIEFIYGYLSTFCGVGGSISITRGILNRERSALILGIIEVVAAIAFFVCFVLWLI